MAGGTVIGLDLGGTKLAVGAVVGGTVLRTVRSDVPATDAEQVVMAAVVDAIRAVFDDTVVGIGCGVPSVVDVDRGVVFEVENIPCWKEVHIGPELEEIFGVPVVVNNDANAFAVGEHHFGAGRGSRHLVGMTLGTGLGTGVIVDGRLYNGANCGAGELGRMPHKGLTLEAWCAGPFFLREYGVAGQEIYRRAKAGDREALAAFERFGSELSEAIAIGLYAYDPEILVLGGSIASAFELFEPALRAGLGSFAYPHVIERLKLVPSSLSNAAVLGAAALYLDAVAGSSREER